MSFEDLKGKTIVRIQKIKNYNSNYTEELIFHVVKKEDNKRSKYRMYHQDD